MGSKISFVEKRKLKLEQSRPKFFGPSVSGNAGQTPITAAAIPDIPTAPQPSPKRKRTSEVAETTNIPLLLKVMLLPVLLS